MKKIYVVLSRTDTKVSKMFGILMPNTKYTHVSISLEQDLKVLYSFARRDIDNPFDGGFVREDFNTGIFGMYQNTPLCVYEVEVTDEQYMKAEQLIRGFYDEYDAYLYNVLGLPFIRVGFPIRRKHHFTCTQFVGYMLNEIDESILTKDLYITKPMDYAHLNNAKKVYEGTIKSFKKYKISQNLHNFNTIEG